MTLRFRFLLEDFNGLAVQLYRLNQNPTSELNQPPFLPVFLAHGTIQDSAVVFPDQPLANNYAVRVFDTHNNRVWFRSDRMRANDFQVQDDDIPECSFLNFVLDPMTFSAADLLSQLPSTPLLQSTADMPFINLIVIDSVSLVIVGDMITVSGTGRAMDHPDVDPNDEDQDLSGINLNAGVVRFPYNYTYHFKLETYGGVVYPGRLLNVVTQAASVVPTSPGIGGAIINFVLNIIIWFVRGMIANSLEAMIQSQIDNALATQLANNTARAATVATLKVDILEGLTLRICAWVELNFANACVCMFTAGSIRFRSSEQLQHLLLIRNRVFRRTLHGEALLALLARYNAEILELLLEHPDALRSLDKVVAGLLQDFREPRSMHQARLSPKTAEALESLGRTLARAGSPELRVLIEELMKSVDMRAFVEKPVFEVLNQRID